MNDIDSDALDILVDALAGMSPSGWGTPTAYLDAGWSDDRYEQAHRRADELLDRLTDMVRDPFWQSD